jgi:hypothetical protein
MVYKDKTFCTFWQYCKLGEQCSVALTPKIQEDAEKWWGNKDAPISVYLDKPDCFKEIENED